MIKPLIWRWTWTSDESSLFPFGLLDEGGPSLDDDRWAATRLAIYRLASDIYAMCLSFSGETIVISGSVTSERTKTLIGRLIALHDLNVQNDLDVHAPFKPAADIDYLDESEEPASEPTETVSRYASIEADDAPVAGAFFEFSVSLKQTPDNETEGPPVVVSKVKARWTVLEIDVNVRSPHLDFEAGGKAGLIRLRPEGDSDQCRFVGKVTPGAGEAGFVEIYADFTYARRHSGSARREFKLESAAPNGQLGQTVALGASYFDIGLDPPTLMVRIVENGKDGSFDWHLFAPKDIKGTDRLYETVDLGDPRGFAQDLLQQCPDLQPGRHMHHLRGIGEKIWNASPQCFRELYTAMHELYGNRFPIQLVTNEPFVPWELMFPIGLPGLTHDHLCVTHPMSRWFAEIEGRRRATLKKGKIISFTPAYRGGRALESAQAEGAWLAENLAAERHSSTYDDFMGFLGHAMPEPVVAIIHFAGHGSSSTDPNGTGMSGLEMCDGWVRENELHSGLTLGERDGSFVVLNACTAAVAAVDLGCVVGFPAQLARRSFGAVLAPIWAVRDGQASQVVCDQIKRLVDGMTLGSSMRDARAIHKNASSTPFAYLCYGDVMAKMTMPPSAQTSATPTSFPAGT